MALVRQVSSGQSPFRPAIVLTERSDDELHEYIYALDLAVWDRACTYMNMFYFGYKTHTTCQCTSNMCKYLMYRMKAVSKKIERCNKPWPNPTRLAAFSPLANSPPAISPAVNDPPAKSPPLAAIHPLVDYNYFLSYSLTILLYWICFHIVVVSETIKLLSLESFSISNSKLTVRTQEVGAFDARRRKT